MPLFMDLHKFPHITIEEAKKAHVADERIQRKYGVKYHQFWVNEKSGTLFCLVEGPDKATCEAVHRMAHAHIACAIVEVDPSFNALIMGENIRVEGGHVQYEDGTVDLGYRTILVLTVQGKPADETKDFEFLKAPKKARELAAKEISNFRGRIIKLTGDDSMVCVFDSATEAVQCAQKIQSGLLLLNKKSTKGKGIVTFSIGVGTGEPVTENNEFFEEAMLIARRLNSAASENSILLSALAHELIQDTKEATKQRFLSAQDEGFLTELFNALDKHLPDENFTIESLVQLLGISRPQLYRKIHGLTGKAPNDFIRDLRLDKSVALLKRKSGNISEIAYEVGFNNPSYFTKCFAQKFHCLPSQFLAAEAE